MSPATTANVGGLGAKPAGFGNISFGNPAAGTTSSGFSLSQPAAANLSQKTVRFELPTATSSTATLTTLLASTTAASTAG